uniref:VWFD domain-containing protein n=1 Tax=Panagrolaimus davidi TaxID=227884 RepID=A0A914PML8_9BILA
MPRIVKAIFNGDKLSTKDFHSALLNGTSMRFATALSFQERSVKIATSAGMPLHILHSLPVIASFNGNAKVQISSENVKIIVKAQPLLSAVQTRKMEIWCPVVNTGVESLRSIELNLPIDMETSVLHKNAEEKVNINLQFPEQKTRLVGLHTLPLTFIRKYDAKLGLHGKTIVKSIRSTMMDYRHKEIHPTQNSFTVSGHYYHPREFTVSALNGISWSSESHVQVNFERCNTSSSAGYSISFWGCQLICSHALPSAANGAINLLEKYFSRFYDQLEEIRLYIINNTDELCGALCLLLHRQNSIGDAINEYSDARRAECRVDGRKIKTFDSVTYKAPIGRCYSIIAKDCARKSFAVLMKTLDEETDAKNIKIVTAKRTIEVELIRQKLVVKVNGENVTDED